jgi:hypothetical protein
LRLLGGALHKLLPELENGHKLIADVFQPGEVVLESIFDGVGLEFPAYWRELLALRNIAEDD